MENLEENQIQKEDVIFTNPTEKTRGIIADLERYIQTEQLNDRDRKKAEKLLEQLREIIKVEVDDRISSERADTVQLRDEESKRHIEQNYVKKEVKTVLENITQAKEATIQKLREENTEKDNVYELDQIKIMNLLHTQQNMENQI